MKRYLLLLLVIISVFTTGCSKIMNIGDPNFQCPYSDTGFGCMKPSEVYMKILNSELSNDEKKEYIAYLTYSCENLNFKETLKANCEDIENYTPEYEKCRKKALEEYTNDLTLCNKIIDEQKYINPVNKIRTVTNLPIRTEKEVYRMWVAPYVDKKNRLNYTSYVFFELGDKTWVYDNNAIKEKSGFENTILSKIQQDNDKQKTEQKTVLPYNPKNIPTHK